MEVPLREIFQAPTIAKLAKYIQKAESNIFISIPPVAKQEYYQVSSAQKRLYILEQLEGIGTSYNMPEVVIIEGDLKRDRLETAFQKLVERHEGLRTSFAMIDGEPVQRIHAQVPFSINYQVGEEARIDKIVSELIQPFDLNKAPLFRVGFAKLSENKHLLLYDMHHIISDGISMILLIREFINRYHGDPLPELRIQYKDFAAWQNELFKTGAIQKFKEYWLKTFSGEIPVLNLPTDYSRPAYSKLRRSG